MGGRGDPSSTEQQNVESFNRFQMKRREKKKKEKKKNIYSFLFNVMYEKTLAELLLPLSLYVYIQSQQKGKKNRKMKKILPAQFD